MKTVGEQIASANDAICRNIELLADQRGLLSQNVLAQLRNIVEGAAVAVHVGSVDAEYRYDDINPALAFVRGKAKLNFLGKFHKLIQISASHYTLDTDASERLMLKYYEYLLRLRVLLRTHCGIVVLANLESFPIDLDPALREYHEKIAARLERPWAPRGDTPQRSRYYIHKSQPVFVGDQIYYEVTFFRAINRVSKFDRVIAFTSIDLTDKYSAYLTLQHDVIEVLGQRMPITLIREWEVSIRPCELNNFARLLGKPLNIQSTSAEYRHLMQWLTATSGSLLDVMDISDPAYAAFRSAWDAGGMKPLILPVLEEARRVIRSHLPGYILLRYLLLRMHNQVLKPQYNWEGCERLSSLKVEWGCLPFETMPFCSSPRGHNPRHADLLESLDPSDRRHEMLARRVRNNVEQEGMLYTPLTDLERFGDVDGLIEAYNARVYAGHGGRKLLQDKGHVFIKKYEDETADIVQGLRTLASAGVAGYGHAVARWLQDTPRAIDDDAKRHALERLFAESRVALIYGAAGTGKSTMVDHIAHYFNDKSKLFLAHTNPAVDNLNRKVTAQNSTFRTIRRQLGKNSFPREFDLLVIDECSTVSNEDLLKVLTSTSFKLLVLVGDVFQIASIQFGNWFSLIRSFVPASAVFELTTPFRTKNKDLLAFWDSVRNLDDNIAELIARHGYSTPLDASLFQAKADDEIILCLNYDGLYGINNVNRFLQGSNPNRAVTWRVSTYKVGDPVLFNDTSRFGSVIFNNLKGWIVDIQEDLGRIQFDVELDRAVSELDVVGPEIEWVRDSIVRFSVFDHEGSDEDDDSERGVVPFQVAYAVSIHKAQGLEYDSVKIVITSANEEDISHSIFYTAITRARSRLQIFWTPETQHQVLSRLRRASPTKDVALLASRRSLSRPPA